MDTMSAFAMGEAHEGCEHKVFDWDKAATIIKEKNAKYAEAGLAEDWEWTGGTILSDGKVPESSSCYLSSKWATPQLCINDEYIDCFKMQSEVPDWKADTFWPESALKILEGK